MVFELRSLVFLTRLLFPLTVKAHAYRVLVVHSYSQEYAWTKHQHAGFIETLNIHLAHPVLYSTEYLDTKRRGLTPAYEQAFMRYLGVKYQDYLPDLIYVIDDNALRFARDALTERFPGIPVIFSNG